MVLLENVEWYGMKKKLFREISGLCMNCVVLQNM